MLFSKTLSLTICLKMC